MLWVLIRSASARAEALLMSTHNIGFRGECEALLMSTHNIGFRGEIRKMPLLLDWKKRLNYSYDYAITYTCAYM